MDRELLEELGFEWDGDALRRLRLQRTLSLGRLRVLIEEKTGVRLGSNNVIYNHELGKMPSTGRIRMYADALDVSPIVFFRRVGP